VGTRFAAQQAQREGVSEISVIEFGVAGGNGLLALQTEAEAVERETGVGIRVFGFDAGPGGMPTLCGDHRDHPDLWQAGDYPMDVEALKRRLTSRTTLIIGDIRERIEHFQEEYSPSPIGFMAVDVDLYSSTMAAFRALDLCPILQHTGIYCDDIDLDRCHRWAGELLAIDDYNATHETRKIDGWRGLRMRPFPEAYWIGRMFMCHDLEAISRSSDARPVLELPL